MKLTDFGFSVMVVDPNKRLKIFCGTPSYMAPEITQRREYHGRPVDVWSLGVLLYAMVAGHFPFTAKTYPELYKKISAGVFKTPDHFSPALSDLLRRLLNADATKRLTLGHAKLHPWCSFAIPAVMAAISVPQQHSLLISADPAEDLVEAVLQRAAQLGFKRQKVVEAVLGRHKSAISTSYYLLLSRMGREARVPSVDGSERAGPATARAAAAAAAGEEDNDPAGTSGSARGAGSGGGAARAPQAPQPQHRPATAMPSSSRGAGGAAAPSLALRAATLTGASAPITGLGGGAPAPAGAAADAASAPPTGAPQRSRTNSADGGDAGGALARRRGGSVGTSPPASPTATLLTGDALRVPTLGDSPPGAGVGAGAPPRAATASRPSSASSLRAASAGAGAPALPAAPTPRSLSRPSSAGGAPGGGLLSGLPRPGEERERPPDRDDGGGGSGSGGGVLFSLPPQRSRSSSRTEPPRAAESAPALQGAVGSGSSGSVAKPAVAAAAVPAPGGGFGAKATAAAPPPAGSVSYLERVAAQARNN